MKTKEIRDVDMHVWSLTLVPEYSDLQNGTNGSTYNVVFRDDIPPREGIYIKCHYSLQDGIYIIKNVEAI